MWKRFVVLCALVAASDALESKRHKKRDHVTLPSLESQHAKMPTPQVPWMPMQKSPFTQLMARPTPPARAGKPFFDPLTMSMYSWWPMMWMWWPMMWWWWPMMMYWHAPRLLLPLLLPSSFHPLSAPIPRARWYASAGMYG